jgi:hypothetical protein
VSIERQCPLEALADIVVGFASKADMCSAPANDARLPKAEFLRYQTNAGRVLFAFQE